MAINLVFMGSSDFSVIILESLVTKFTLTGVVTQPDRPAGRGKISTPPPVKISAELLNLPLIQPERLRAPEVFDQLAAWQPDLIVVAAYGQILRQNVLALPEYGCINVHASFLPRWRGAAPIQASILNGDEFSGVTIMKMDAGIDTGPELAKKKVVLDAGETSTSLSKKLATVGGMLLLNALEKYISGVLVPVAQPEVGATYATMIRKEEGWLDPTQPAVYLERKIRAFMDWPGAFFKWGDHVLKVRKAQVLAAESTEIGKRGVIDGYPRLDTIDGSLMLIEVQPSGKKWMSGKDFMRGAHGWLE